MIFNALKQLRTLQKNQYLPPAELKALQESKLRKIVRHAYKNVAYYRNLFDREGINPEDIKDVEHLYKIPITKKDDLKNSGYPNILSKGGEPENCVLKQTSGSTGEPLKLFFSVEERDFQILVNLRIFLSAGFKLTDKTVYLSNPRRFPQKKYWFQHLGILRRDYLSVFDAPEAHIDALRRLKPDFLYGYASSLIPLAHSIQEQAIKDISPKAVFSSTETLEQKSRTLIESAMNTKVYDLMGSNELGDIAWECPAHEGFHLNNDTVILEFLDEHNNPVQPGQTGRLVCTSLYGYTMPFIRYELGDICVLSDKMCSCGRTLPLMESVKGRANDFIVLPDGKRMASFFLVIIMQDFLDIVQYRVIQEQKDRILVQIVTGKEGSETTRHRIKEEIESALQHRVTVRVETVQQIPKDPSGKIRTVVSNVLIPE